VYRITFDTTEYMQRCKAAHPAFFPDKPFYPSVSVHFQILPSQVGCAAALVGGMYGVPRLGRTAYWASFE
jgi:hypothetical protein